MIRFEAEPGDHCLSENVPLPELSPMPSVYVETTIPSYLAAARSRDLIVAARQQITPLLLTPDELLEYPNGEDLC